MIIPRSSISGSRLYQVIGSASLNVGLASSECRDIHLHVKFKVKPPLTSTNSPESSVPASLRRCTLKLLALSKVPLVAQLCHFEADPGNQSPDRVEQPMYCQLVLPIGLHGK